LTIYGLGRNGKQQRRERTVKLEDGFGKKEGGARLAMYPLFMEKSQNVYFDTF
jgi:hypothetical protein